MSFVPHRPTSPPPLSLSGAEACCEPFPIAAAVGGVMVVLIFGAIIAVFSVAQKRRLRKPASGAVDVEAAAESPTSPAKPRPMLTIEVPPRAEVESVVPTQSEAGLSESRSESRAEGNMNVSSPAGAG
ncbi:hypothetical protein DFH06DRAFT_1297092 [Mycena polygramma]|nr:hypothetical protein DFH06DRAFT_1297092 [Mycena polygramma]